MKAHRNHLQLPLDRILAVQGQAKCQALAAFLAPKPLAKLSKAHARKEDVLEAGAQRHPQLAVRLEDGLDLNPCFLSHPSTTNPYQAAKSNPSRPLQWTSPRPLKALPDPVDHQRLDELLPKPLRKTNASVAYVRRPKPATSWKSTEGHRRPLPRTRCSPCATSRAWQCRSSKMTSCPINMHRCSAIRSGTRMLKDTAT